MSTFLVSISDMACQRVVADYNLEVPYLYQLVIAQTARDAIEIARWGHVLSDTERTDYILSKHRDFGEIPV